MKALMVLAASGLAREALAVERTLGRYSKVVVLDDDPRRAGELVAGHRVLGGIDLASEFDDHDVLVCAGRGSARRAIVARLSSLGIGSERYATTIHPKVEVPDGCRVGHGSVLLAGVVLTADVTVGPHVVVMPNSTLTHDDVIEEFATICAGVQLGGGVRIGSGAYLGMGSCVREGLSVGADAVLGMGAVLTASMPSSQTWAGVPARRLDTPMEVDR